MNGIIAKIIFMREPFGINSRQVKSEGKRYTETTIGISNNGMCMWRNSEFYFFKGVSFDTRNQIENILWNEVGYILVVDSIT